MTLKKSRDARPIQNQIKNEFNGVTYSCLNQIGFGGCATIFRGRVIKSGREVAIKRIISDVEWSFEYEKNILSQCNHPNIIIMVDAFVYKSDSYIITEYAENTLENAIRENGALDGSKIISLAIQICRSLNYIHFEINNEKPFIHRDVKPENIFIFNSNQLFKLADFGATTQNPQETQIPIVDIADPWFVAPELITYADANMKTDLYQFGLLLLYAEIGKRPIIKGGHDEVLRNVRSGIARRVSLNHKWGNFQLGEIVSELLHPDPKSRPDDTRLLLSKLEKLD